MPYCSKCGAEVSEEMAFCSKCGTPLKVARAPAPYRAEKGEKTEKREKEEKREKTEKMEKTEKYESREVGFMGPLIGGLILICLGSLFYLTVAGLLRFQNIWPLFLIVAGILIIVGIVYGMIMATRRQPRT